MQRLVTLLRDEAVAHCTFLVLSPRPRPCSTEHADLTVPDPLRLELYSDLLLALALESVSQASTSSHD